MTKEQRLWKELQAKRREADAKLQKIIAANIRTKNAEIAEAHRKFEADTASERQDYLDETRPFEQAWVVEYQKTRSTR